MEHWSHNNKAHSPYSISQVLNLEAHKDFSSALSSFLFTSAQMLLLDAALQSIAM